MHEIVFYLTQHTVRLLYNNQPLNAVGGGKFVFIGTTYATLCVHCVGKIRADRSVTAGVTRSCHWSSKG